MAVYTITRAEYTYLRVTAQFRTDLDIHLCARGRDDYTVIDTTPFVFSRSFSNGYASEQRVRMVLLSTDGKETYKNLW